MSSDTKKFLNAGLRHSPRATLLQNINVRAVDSNFAPASLVDISQSGAKVVSPLEMSPSQIFEIHWVPVPGLAPLFIEAECVWSAPNGSMGVRFKNLGPRIQCVLKSFIAFHLGRSID